MKCITLIAFVGLAAVHVLAAPSKPVIRDEYLDIPFNFKVSTVDDTQVSRLDGQFLTRGENGTFGIFETNSTPVTVYPSVVLAEDGGIYYEFHVHNDTSPLSDAVGFIGDQDLAVLAEVSPPWESPSPSLGAKVGQFSVIPEGEPMQIQVVNNGSSGKWLSFPAFENGMQGWKTMWASDEAILTEDYIPVNITLVCAGGNGTDCLQDVRV